MPLRFRMSQASFASARVAECLDDTGSLSRAKLQKPQRALQALVMAKWHVPGPPSQTASSAIFQIEGRFGTALPILAFASRRTTRGSSVRPLTSLSSGRDALLEGSILGLPGLIEEKPAEQARSRPGSRTEPRVPTDRAKYGAAAGADGRAGQRALLGRGHIGASGDRQSDGREHQ
jgi:hypothetical protein